jgi:hypothetical protein
MRLAGGERYRTTEHVPGSIAIATVSLMPIGHGDGGKDSSTLVFLAGRRAGLGL